MVRDVTKHEIAKSGSRHCGFGERDRGIADELQMGPGGGASDRKGDTASPEITFTAERRTGRNETETDRSKGPASSRPSRYTRVNGELPLRHNGRRRWRLAFAHLGIGSNAEESKHRGH